MFKKQITQLKKWWEKTFNKKSKTKLLNYRSGRFNVYAEENHFWHSLVTS